MNINLNTKENVNTILFPDNQPHVNIGTVIPGEFCHVTCSITDSIKLLQLQMVADAIDTGFGVKDVLYIPYLMGARFDRVMNVGDSFDLRVIAKIINSLNFRKVILLDPHSEVSTALINNCVTVDNFDLVKQIGGTDKVLIIPDAGASKKAAKYLKWSGCLKDSVQCIKSRDLKTGEISLSILEAEKCSGEDCVIIDDLCDGGGTFIEIAKQLGGIPKSLTLVVTHGIFSKGFGSLEKYFDRIVVSNSYNRTYNSKIVQVEDYSHEGSIFS